LAGRLRKPENITNRCIGCSHLKNPGEGKVTSARISGEGGGKYYLARGIGTREKFENAQGGGWKLEGKKSNGNQKASNTKHRGQESLNGTRREPTSWRAKLRGRPSPYGGGESEGRQKENVVQNNRHQWKDKRARGPLGFRGLPSRKEGRRRNAGAGVRKKKALDREISTKIPRPTQPPGSWFEKRTRNEFTEKERKERRRQMNHNAGGQNPK